jgi:RHS repeat-associated protein
MPRSLVSRVLQVISLLACFVAAVIVRPVSAQVAPMCQTGCIPPYQVTVTPDRANGGSFQATTNGHSLVFSVRNTGANYDEYEISAGATSDSIVRITGWSDSLLALDPVGGENNSAQVTVYFDAGTTGSATITLTAVGTLSGDQVASDLGSYNISVTGTPPCQTAMSVSQAPTNPSYHSTATVRVSYHTITGGCNVVPGYPDTSSFTFTVNGVDRRSYFTITDTAAVASALPLTDLATNTLETSIKGFNGFEITHYQALQTYVDTEPAPAIYTTVINYDDQDMSRCAVDCFAAVYSQSTVPYFSMDGPRNVSLVYHGDRVAPRPLILIDMEHPAGANLPSDFRLEAKLNGTWITFLNGEQTLHFQPAYGRLRVGGQFDASAYATGVYSLQIIVTSLYGSHLRQDTVNTKLTIVNEGQSFIGRGWSIVGLPRLYVQSDGSLLIVEGDGSATYFAKVCAPTCNYVSPPGDFTRMVDSTGSSAWNRLYPDSTKVTFGTNGIPVRIRDRFGNATLIAVQFSSNRISTIQDPTGRQIVLGYGPYGLATLTDPMGRVTNVTVASDSTLRAIKDPDGDSTQFIYDGSRRLQQVIDRRGGITRFVYNSSSWKLDSLVLPAISINGGANQSPTIAYTPWQTAGVPNGATSGSPYPGVLVDSVSARITDPEGHATRLFVDRWGQPTKVLDALSTPTSISYDANGLPIHVLQFSAPNQVSDSATWDAQGNLTFHSGTGVPTTHFTYGAYAQPDSTWASDGSAAHAWVGVSGRTDSVRLVGQDSIKFRYTYDAQGRVLTATDPLSHITRYHYESSFGNQDSVLAPGNRFSRIRFDRYGRDSASSGTSTPWSRKIYDATNRLVQFYDGVNANPTAYGYDKLFLTRVQDPKGQVYLFAYNALGLVTQRFDPADTLNRYDSYRYDRDGLTVGWTNRRGQALSFAYDVLHRLTAKGGTNTVADSFAYSLEGKRMVSWNGVVRDTIDFYPGNTRIDTTVTRIAGHRFQLLDFIGNLGRLDSLTIGSDTRIAFVTRRAWYNSHTQALDSLGLNAAHIKFSMNADGRRTGVTLPTSPVVTLGKKTTSIHTVQDDTLSPGPLGATLGRRYGYDDLGRMWYDVANAGDKWIKFGYDGLSRLTSADYRTKLIGTNCSVDGDNGWLCDDGISGRDSLKSYSYDQVGNRTDNSGSYSTGNRIATFAGFTFEHDLDGNVTRKYGNGQDVHYYWSAESRLDSVVAGTVVTAYGYDPHGQLVRKRVGGVDKRFFLWHGDQLVAELDSSGQKRVGEYAYYPGVDQALALITGDTTPVLTRYYRQDQIGNVTGVLKDTSVVQKVTYGSWGDQQQITGTIADSSRLRWKGLIWEGDSTRLYYIRARWFDPTTGRFVTEDPLGLTYGINPYVFGGADPVGSRDPTGRGMTCYYYEHHVVTDANTGDFLYEYDVITPLPQEVCGGGGNDGGKGGPAIGQPFVVFQGNQQGQCPIAGPTQWPVAAPHPVTSPFGASRGRGSSPHVGMDIGIPNGTAVYPLAAGTVASVTPRSRQGGIIVVSHGGGYVSVYMHLGGINENISFVGDQVDLGDVLGWSGAPGEPGRGPHLHLELNQGKQHTNPASCLP